MPRATANAVSVPTTAQIASNVIILPSALPTVAAWPASFLIFSAVSAFTPLPISPRANLERVSLAYSRQRCRCRLRSCQVDQFRRHFVDIHTLAQLFASAYMLQQKRMKKGLTGIRC